MSRRVRGPEVDPPQWSREVTAAGDRLRVRGTQPSRPGTPDPKMRRLRACAVGHLITSTPDI